MMESSLQSRNIDLELENDTLEKVIAGDEEAIAKMESKVLDKKVELEKNLKMVKRHVKDRIEEIEDGKLQQRKKTSQYKD